MAADPTIFDTPHHQALELMAVRALATGQAVTAFQLADRRCRIPPPPNAHCYLLRAEASYRIREIAEAISDLDLALEISPLDILANRRMLAWANGQRQHAAAAAVLAGDHGSDSLHAALTLLLSLGRRSFASVAVLDDVIQGWTAWCSEGPVELSIANSTTRVTLALEPDPFHPLTGPGISAVEINVQRPKSQEAQSIMLRVSNKTFFSTWAPPNQTREAPRCAPDCKSADRRVTVIVPVYRDYEATKACIDSLLAASPPDKQPRILIIDDATPDSRIRRHLSQLRKTSHVELITNPTNMGFVGAVNLALGWVADDDVVLLNSDTITPPGFLERLSAVANASPDIGTVTPLSNNGELMSFPRPNEINRLGSRQEIISIDNIAARVNRGTVIDLPTGIGFCLYITRRCLDRLGGLSDRFQRGYLEDVDFCLRAREIGMRSVCATDVYVGHVGSGSFREEKRSLVARNFKVLEKSFARYAPECLAFVELDPLRSARAAIEQAMPPRQNPILIVTGHGAIAAVARERAKRLTSQKSNVLICEIQGSARPEVVLFDPLGEAPQSVRFGLRDAGERHRLLAFIKRTSPSRIEFIDSANIPGDLAEALCELGAPYDFFIADGGLFGAVTERSVQTKVSDFRSLQLRWARLLEGANQILVPCRRAEALALRFLSDQHITKIRRAPLYSKTRQISPMRGAHRFGIVPIRTSAHELSLIREIARFMKRAHPQLSIIVLGETLDDIGLMRFGNVFVSGLVGVAEVRRLIRQYQLKLIFTAFGKPLFGHPIIETAINYGLPTAYVDWSLGACRARRNDLRIDPSLACRDVAAVLGRWIAEQ